MQDSKTRGNGCRVGICLCCCLKPVKKEAFSWVLEKVDVAAGAATVEKKMAKARAGRSKAFFVL